MTPDPAERTDFRELKEIIKEILHQLDYAYNYRLQKLVFYGDIWCLQNFGKRLTDASFKPYNYGSYSDDVLDALDELVEEGEIEYQRVMKSDGPTRKYLSHPDGGELSSAKKEIIKQILDETARLSSEELEQFSKQTWLFKNTEEGEPMNFEFYVENVVLTGSKVEGLARQDNEPLNVDDFESLIPT
jgi:uncharacterized phage-associated protein